MCFILASSLLFLCALCFQLAVDVIALLKGVLPSVASINQPLHSTVAATPPDPDSRAVVEAEGAGSLSDVAITKSTAASVGTATDGQPHLPVTTHHIVVESDHPYSTAACSGYTVSGVFRWKYSIVDIGRLLLTISF